MRDLVRGHDQQWRGLEARMAEMNGHLASIRKRVHDNYIRLDTLARRLGINTKITLHSDETTVVSSLADLIKELEK
uniref:Uncharacterized protein n=1 Tax=Oryza meridionalis TaxID=40149 RepID=A0A0E0FDI3_9ORYZ